MPDNPPTVDKPKPSVISSLSGFDIRADTRAVQSIEGSYKLLIAATVGIAVGGYQQVVGFEMQRFLQFDAAFILAISWLMQ